MWYVIVGVICLIVGFLGGFFVYRNNINRLKKREADIREFFKSKGQYWPFD